jgi:four helix bundle protein
MSSVEHFEDLKVWQLARQLTSKVYALARQGDFAKDHGFRDQICRSAVSVVSNIAEGFERRSNNQFQHFLDIANGSAGELRAQLYIALDLAYVTPEQFRDIHSDIVAIGKMLTSLIRHLRSSPARPASPTPSHKPTQPPNHPTT